MITKNFKTMLACVLEATSYNISKGILPIKAYNGTVAYTGPYFSNYFPANPYVYMMTSSSDTGICIGSGTTAATEDDYKLEHQITSGFSGSIVSIVSKDSNGNPQITFTISLSNTSNSQMSISEIGYQQRIYGAAQEGGSTTSDYKCLLDRTVLSTPCVIPAGGTGIIEYVLKTVISS